MIKAKLNKKGYSKPEAKKVKVKVVLALGAAKS